MQPMSDGMNLDPEVLNQTLLNKLAQGAIREAQMEAAVQQLLQEKQNLEAQLDALRTAADEAAEADEA